MELNKRKYKRSQVETMLKDNQTLYENQIFEQKIKISELETENDSLKLELESLKSKQTLIDNAMINAEKHSKEVQEKIDLQYKLTSEKLKNFYHNWSEYFNNLKEKTKSIKK